MTRPAVPGAIPLVVPAGRGTLDARGVRTVLPMFVSYILRLRPNGLGRGQVTGEIEAVATGRRAPLRSADELIAFLGLTGDEEAARVRAASRSISDQP